MLGDGIAVAERMVVHAISEREASRSAAALCRSVSIPVGKVPGSRRTPRPCGPGSVACGRDIGLAAERGVKEGGSDATAAGADEDDAELDCETAADGQLDQPVEPAGGRPQTIKT